MVAVCGLTNQIALFCAHDWSRPIRLPDFRLMSAVIISELARSGPERGQNMGARVGLEMTSSKRK